MKRTLLALISICFIMIVGCDSDRKKSQAKYVSKYWQVIEIDGCEYIENSRWNDVPLTHKANCNNPIHLK